MVFVDDAYLLTYYAVEEECGVGWGWRVAAVWSVLETVEGVRVGGGWAGRGGGGWGGCVCI